ncbi:tyrosine-type recombinase/integrase [Metabacillus sediminilitoris]|uniref:Uncharacterized protein n=1 Tax=Metabacillus sediminilitoris TaxID=2567941 RepID=A0A4S4BHI3_9BACI|nr:tyrosine-type recombinase/integrase [Metabacillus sediminilitoris]QGQ46632.1 tyrosine-type recombinase/integrase [Metabacillus sediminilitoris]THF74022.1 hypothetical protein E6W99_25855 [Metabacillus sediminilitoris]
MKRKRMTVRVNSVNENEGKSFNFTFEQAFEYFISAKSEGLREGTIGTHYEHYGFFTKWLEEANSKIKRVNDLDMSIIRDYINYMKEDHFNCKTKKSGLSTQTINGRIRFLKTFYNLLFKEEISNTNPAEQIKLLKTYETPFEPLTEKEMMDLLNVPDLKQFPQWRDYCIMMLLYDSGMRINEAINLTKNEVHFKARRIVLPAERNKTRKPRIIPLSNHVIKLLLELISENEVNFESEFVFLNWYGEQLAEDSFRRNLKRYVEKAGIKKHFSCHDFRRQYCTEFLSQGGSLFALQSIVGHSQISTTRKYVRFDEQTIKNQHELYCPVVKLRNKFK